MDMPANTTLLDDAAGALDLSTLLHALEAGKAQPIETPIEEYKGSLTGGRWCRLQHYMVDGKRFVGFWHKGSIVAALRLGRVGKFSLVDWLRGK